MVEKIKAVLSHIPKWLMTGVVLALVLWFTLAPHPTGQVNIPLFPGADKIVHGIMFGVLAFVCCVDLMRSHGWRQLSLAAIGCVGIGTAVLGVVIEVIQEKMGLGRTMEIMDMLADAAGALTACVIWAVLNKPFANTP